MTVIDKKTKQKKKKIRKGNGKKSWHRGNSRRKNVGSSAEYLLETDRYDLIRMDHTMRILHAMEMDEEEEEDCDIVLEAWPQLIHRVPTRTMLRQVLSHQHLSEDVLHAVTYTHAVIQWRIWNNGRKLKKILIQFPMNVTKMMYLKDSRLYVTLDKKTNLAILGMSKGNPKKMEVLIAIPNICNALCMEYIRETKQIVVGGIGHLKTYVLAGTERNPVVDNVRMLRFCLGENEYIRKLQVDTLNRRLIILTERGLLLVDYVKWTMVRRFADKEIECGAITCCCIYRDNVFFITGSKSGTIKIWNAVLFLEIHAYKGHCTEIKAITTSSPHALLFSASYDGWVFIWKLDKFGEPVHKVKVGCQVITMGLTIHYSSLGFWCVTNTHVAIYEFYMFTSEFAALDSTVYKLLRLQGCDVHPNRIMVATEDGGMRLVNPITAISVGCMFPMTTMPAEAILTLIQTFAYDAFRKHMYTLFAGSDWYRWYRTPKQSKVVESASTEMVVLSCENNPFRCLHMFTHTSHDDYVTCMTSVLVNVGQGLKDLVVFVGFQNGQVQVLSSDLFLMPRPVQAHQGSMLCLEKADEVETNGVTVHRSSRLLVTAGSDLTIRVWELLCRPESGQGLVLHMNLLLDIRVGKAVRLVSAIQDRIVFVFEKSNVVNMYDTGAKSVRKTPVLVTHGVDYDHTDTITSLNKCPLLRIFATASLDRTVKIWDEENELVRELVFMCPVTGCCFATDLGHVLLALDKTIHLVDPERYLPRNYMKHFQGKQLQANKELREVAMNYEVNLRTWISPSGIPRFSMKCLGQRHLHPRLGSLPMEEWNLLFESETGRTMELHLPMPVAKDLREQGTPGRTPLATDEAEDKAVVRFIPPGSHKRGEPTLQRAQSRNARPPSEHSETASSHSWSFHSHRRGQDVVLETQGGEQAGMVLKRARPRDLTKQAVPRKASQELTKEDVCRNPGVDALDEETVKLLEGLSLVRIIPKEFEILLGRAHGSDISLDDDEQPSLSKSTASSLDLPAGLCVTGWDHRPAGRKVRSERLTLRECIARQDHHLSDSSRLAVLMDLDDAISDIEENDMNPSKRAFLLQLARNVHRAVVEAPDAACLDDLVKKHLREAYRCLFAGPPVPDPYPMPPFMRPLVPRVVSPERRLQLALTPRRGPYAKERREASPGSKDVAPVARKQKKKERGAKKEKVFSGLKAARGKMPLRDVDGAILDGKDMLSSPETGLASKGRDVSTLTETEGTDKRKKMQRPKDELSLPPPSKMRASLRKSVQEALKGIGSRTPELDEILKQVRLQPWFPGGVPSDAAGTVAGWLDALAQTKDKNVLVDVFLLTANKIRTGHLPEQLKKQLLEAVKAALAGADGTLRAKLQDVMSSTLGAEDFGQSAKLLSKDSKITQLPLKAKKSGEKVERVPGRPGDREWKGATISRGGEKYVSTKPMTEEERAAKTAAEKKGDVKAKTLLSAQEGGRTPVLHAQDGGPGGPPSKTSAGGTTPHVGQTSTSSRGQAEHHPPAATQTGAGAVSPGEAGAVSPGEAGGVRAVQAGGGPPDGAVSKAGPQPPDTVSKTRRQKPADGRQPVVLGGRQPPGVNATGDLHTPEALLSVRGQRVRTLPDALGGFPETPGPDQLPAEGGLTVTQQDQSPADTPDRGVVSGRVSPTDTPHRGVLAGRVSPADTAHRGVVSGRVSPGRDSVSQFESLTVGHDDKLSPQRGTVAGSTLSTPYPSPGQSATPSPRSTGTEGSPVEGPAQEAFKLSRTPTPLAILRAEAVVSGIETQTTAQFGGGKDYGHRLFIQGIAGFVYKHALYDLMASGKKRGKRSGVAPVKENLIEIDRAMAIDLCPEEASSLVRKKPAEKRVAVTLPPVAGRAPPTAVKDHGQPSLKTRKGHCEHCHSVQLVKTVMERERLWRQCRERDSAAVAPTQYSTLQPTQAHAVDDSHKSVGHILQAQQYRVDADPNFASETLSQNLTAGLSAHRLTQESKYKVLEQRHSLEANFRVPWDTCPAPSPSTGRVPPVSPATFRDQDAPHSPQQDDTRVSEQAENGDVWHGAQQRRHTPSLSSHQWHGKVSVITHKMSKRLQRLNMLSEKYGSKSLPTAEAQAGKRHKHWVEGPDGTPLRPGGEWKQSKLYRRDHGHLHRSDCARKPARLLPILGRALYYRAAKWGAPSSLRITTPKSLECLTALRYGPKPTLRERQSERGNVRWAVTPERRDECEEEQVYRIGEEQPTWIKKYTSRWVRRSVALWDCEEVEQFLTGWARRHRDGELQQAGWPRARRGHDLRLRSAEPDYQGVDPEDVRDLQPWPWGRWRGGGGGVRVARCRGLHPHTQHSPQSSGSVTRIYWRTASLTLDRTKVESFYDHLGLTWSRGVLCIPLAALRRGGRDRQEESRLYRRERLDEQTTKKLKLPKVQHVPTSSREDRDMLSIMLHYSSFGNLPQSVQARIKDRLVPSPHTRFNTCV